MVRGNMSRLKQYLSFLALLVIFRWTFVGDFLQSSVFLHVVFGVIGILWGMIIIIALREKRKRKQKEEEASLKNDERA